MEGSEHIEQRLEGLRLVHDGKGDEEAHAGGVDGGGGDLEVPRQFDLPFRLERIDVTADLEDVRGDGVTGSVVSPLGRRGVGDADPLDAARIIGRQGLVLDAPVPAPRRIPCRLSRTAAEHRAPAASPCRLLHQPDCARHRHRTRKSGIHGHPDGDPHFDGIDADVVIHVIQFRNGVEVLEMPQWPPWDQTVSYSGCLVT